MNLLGKGFWIWRIRYAEKGNASEIANVAKAANLTHVLIKIADGTDSSNVDPNTGVDLLPPVLQALRAKNIAVWGWHYIYGDKPVEEARVAVDRVKQYNLDGYIIDAEAEFQATGMDEAARKFVTELRNGLPGLPIALSSFRFPSYHPKFPWKDFLEKCDLNMPQVYWEQAHNPASQLNRTVREFKAMTPYRPIIPTGPTYSNEGWAPTPAEIAEFMDTVRLLNLPAVNFFSWDECRPNFNNLWNVVHDYSWPVPPPNQDVPEQYIALLNTHDSDQVISLYTPNAVHIDASQTIQGMDLIRVYYKNLFTNLFPNTTFILTGSSGTGTTRHFTWRATSSSGQVSTGDDTLGILDGHISYHYTYFTPLR
jgi:hypothetical protein